MYQLSPEAGVVAQVLLEHHDIMRRNGQIRRPECLITYGRLCVLAEIPEWTSHVDELLNEVAGWCERNGWPPLNALAVDAMTMKPAREYGDAPGCSFLTWDRDVARCLACTDYPQLIPHG